MSIVAQLEQLKSIYESQLEAGGSSEYIEMMAEVCQELIQLTTKVAHLMQAHDLLKKQIDEEWKALHQSLHQVVDLLEQTKDHAYEVVKGKRYYELIDDCMAEIDDCLDDLNEKLVCYHENIPYLESWDIGLFF